MLARVVAASACVASGLPLFATVAEEFLTAS
jgi:hypothetical protein